MSTGTGVNQGKTAFLEGFLPGNRGADLTAINEAWRASGKEGTVSESLVNKLRSRLRLSKARRVKGGASGSKAASVAKAKSKASSKGTMAKLLAVGLPSSTAKAPNKTAFIRELLGQDATVHAKAVGRAWTKAGNEGSISDNLYYKTKADMGIKGRKGSPKGASASKPEWEASGRSATHSNGRHPAPSVTPRAASSSGGGRDRALHEIEAEIDELVFRLRGLGGYDEVQEALRAARRLLVRSHEA